jgi:hypothetical protein
MCHEGLVGGRLDERVSVVVGERVGGLTTERPKVGEGAVEPAS